MILSFWNVDQASFLAALLIAIPEKLPDKWWPEKASSDGVVCKEIFSAHGMFPEISPYEMLKQRRWDQEIFLGKLSRKFLFWQHYPQSTADTDRQRAVRLAQALEERYSSHQFSWQKFYDTSDSLSARV